MRSLVLVALAVAIGIPAGLALLGGVYTLLTGRTGPRTSETSHV